MSDKLLEVVQDHTSLVQGAPVYFGGRRDEETASIRYSSSIQRRPS